MCVISILQVFRRICNINERVERTIQVRREEHEAATILEDPSGEIFWADIFQNFDDEHFKRTVVCSVQTHVDHLDLGLGSWQGRV